MTLRSAFILTPMLLASLALAETMSRESGISISDSGIQIQTPVGGRAIDVRADQSGFELNFSLTGSRPGQQAGSGSSGNLPIQRLAPIPPSSALSNSDEFFRGVGKPEAAPVSRRPLAK